MCSVNFVIEYMMVTMGCFTRRQPSALVFTDETTTSTRLEVPMVYLATFESVKEGWSKNVFASCPIGVGSGERSDT
jgi:hypothetical protein